MKSARERMVRNLAPEEAALMIIAVSGKQKVIIMKGPQM